MKPKKRHPATSGVLKNLGLRIKEIRLEAGLTQEDLSAKLKMLLPNYARIEQGRMNVTVDTLVRLSKGLGVEIGEFFAKPKVRKARVGRPPKSRS